MTIDPLTDNSTTPEPRRPRGPLVWPVAVLLVVLVGLAIYYFGWYRDREPPPQPVEPVAAEPAPEAPPAAEPAFELPPLATSDEAVRQLIAALSADPRLLTWLAEDELIRRFTVSVVNISEGVSPRRHLEFMAPEGEFQVRRADDRVWVDPASYRRYDRVAMIFSSLDAAGTAEAYRRLEPLMDEAYRDLGYPDRAFRHALERAFAELLAVPRVAPALELEPDVRSYELANPALEGLSEAQKQLLRMGPENVARVQEKLRQIAAELDLEV